MFTPHRHSISASGLELDQMLQLPYGHHMPLPAPIVDLSSTTTTRRWKPSIEIAPNCPRCASTNTKFCYYNNYSLSQPRYFCKGCRRYWTKGGSLRNVPVGGGCRKNRRGKSSRNHHHSERISNGINSSVFEDRESSAGEGDQATDTNGSRDIDMALVFAKFLNQNPTSGSVDEIESEGNNNVSSSSNNFSSSLTPESVEIEKDVVVQPQKESDPFERTNQSFIGGDQELSLSGIELEGFLGEDVVWSHATAGSSVTWQQPMMPTMQLQELEYSMPFNDEEEGQLFSSSMSLMSDSWSGWSSFDLSTMEVFSTRP